MSRHDFCLCTPSEFSATWEAFSQHEQTAERSAWERIRMLALCTLQPYASHRLTPTDVMTFPWEQDSGHAKAAPQALNTQDAALTRKELMKRYERMKKLRGLT